MTYSDHTPRARHWAAPAFFSVVMFVWAYSLQGEAMIALVVIGAAFVFGLWATTNFFHHVGWAWNQIKADLLNAQYNLSEAHLASVVQKMNSEQIKALRMFGGQLIETIPANEDELPVEKIFGVNVYLYFAWYVLRNSNDAHVKPISEFFADTYHFDLLNDGEVDDVTQAREFTAWLVRYSYATWHLSNKAARWTSPNARRRAMKRLGLDDDTFENPLKEL